MNWNWTNTAFMGAGTTRAPILRACRADQRVSYYLYVPRGFTRENAKEYSLAVVIHGTTRNADKMRDAFVPFADETKTLVLAPLFPTGLIEREDIHNYKFIAFHDMRFDLLLNDMADEVSEAMGIDGSTFLLYGFSGGGQFVHRYVYLHPDRLKGAVVGAPGRSTYPDDALWPDGIQGMKDIFGHNPNFSKIRNVPLLFVVGQDDTEAVDYEGDATYSVFMNRYGSNRLERVEALAKAFSAKGCNASFEAVPNAKHEWKKTVDAATAFFKKCLEAQN